MQDSIGHYRPSYKAKTALSLQQWRMIPEEVLGVHTNLYHLSTGVSFYFRSLSFWGIFFRFSYSALRLASLQL